MTHPVGREPLVRAEPRDLVDGVVARQETRVTIEDVLHHLTEANVDNRFVKMYL